MVASNHPEISAPSTPLTHYHLFSSQFIPGEFQRQPSWHFWSIEPATSSLSLPPFPLLPQFCCMSTNSNIPCIAYRLLHCSHVKNTASRWNQASWLQVCTHTWSGKITTKMASFFIHDQTRTASRQYLGSLVHSLSAFLDGDYNFSFSLKSIEPPSHPYSDPIMSFKKAVRDKTYLLTYHITTWIHWQCYPACYIDDLALHIAQANSWFAP